MINYYDCTKYYDEATTTTTTTTTTTAPPRPPRGARLRRAAWGPWVAHVKSIALCVYVF